MLEVQRIQAVALKEQKSPLERVDRQKGAEEKIKLGPLPRDVKSFFDFVPLGFQLEAYVKKATREEVLLRLRFMGREIEISVKNLLGLEFRPNQKVLLTLIDRNPYILKVSLPLAEGYKIFSQVRNFFKSPIPAVLNTLLGLPSVALGIKNSGIFYESKVVRYLLRKEDKEALKGDIKYKLLGLAKRMGFTRPKFQLLARPLGFAKIFGSLPFYRINLEAFVRAYAPFYELSPKLVETFTNFLFLTREKIVKRFPQFVKKRNKIKELDKPIFFSQPSKEVYKPLTSRAVSYNLLKETMNFIQFLQGWSVVQNYQKAIIPFTYGGRKFFLGFYGSGGIKNISLLWEKGMVKLSYAESNPYQGELLFVLKEESLIPTFRNSVEELKKQLKEVYFTVTDVKFVQAPNTEELFILDMADKEHSNFIKIYL